MSNSTQRSTAKKTLMAICAVMLLGTFGATPAFAKACKNVHIEVKNGTGNKIKILDMDYWDSESEKWRSKPVKNEIINKNRTWQKNYNLGRVNGQDVRIRIKYKKQKWSKFFKKWVSTGKTIRSMSKVSKCKRYAEYIMTL